MVYIINMFYLQNIPCCQIFIFDVDLEYLVFAFSSPVIIFPLTPIIIKSLKISKIPDLSENPQCIYTQNHSFIPFKSRYYFEENTLFIIWQIIFFMPTVFSFGIR